MRFPLRHSTLIAATCVAASFAFISCATKYQKVGFSGGFSETRLAPDVFRVSFSGNGHTRSERAQDFVLLRAAELTLQNGYRYFKVLDGRDEVTTQTVTLPGSSYTTANATAYGNSVYGSATTTYTPPQNINIYKPSSGLMIRCFATPPKEGGVFDAQFIANSIRGKYRLKAS